MTHPKQRSQRKTQTRERLVRHALHACSRQGFSAVRTADIAKAAGLSHGALFVHFPSRDDLLREVAAHFGRNLTDRLHALATDGASLGDVLRAHLECIREREDLYRRFIVEGPAHAPGFRTIWTGIQSAISHHLSRAAQREERAGRNRRVAPHLLFNTWIGLVHHYLIHKDLFAPRGSVLEKVGPELIEHFLLLLRKDPT